MPRSRGRPPSRPRRRPISMAAPSRPCALPPAVMRPGRVRWGTHLRAVLLGAALICAGCQKAPGGAPAPPAPAAAPTQDAALTVVRPGGLGYFVRDLKRLEAGRLTHLAILQLGDSHTAGDVFSGRLRALFQARFGNAGRGMMPPGHAFDGLRQKEVTVTQSGPWEIENSFRPSSTGPFGISGFLARSTGAGARMTVAPTEGGTFDKASVDYLEHPGGGRFDIELDGRVATTVSTSGPEGQPGHAEVAAPAGTHELEVVARAPGIALSAWSIERRNPGILLDSHGVSGATVSLVDRWDPLIVAHDINEIHPSLIIVAYGTNEGFQYTLDGAAYAETFAGVLARLKRLAPEASILVVGPPDGQRIDPGCPTRQSAPLACRWTTPPALASVRAIQRAAAHDAGALFWDWSSVMTPAGGIDAWVRAEPPLARGDHVHFTVAGYEKAADALFEVLMADYMAPPVGLAAPADRPT